MAPWEGPGRLHHPHPHSHLQELAGPWRTWQPPCAWGGPQAALLLLGGVWEGRPPESSAASGAALGLGGKQRSLSPTPPPALGVHSPCPTSTFLSSRPHAGTLRPRRPGQGCQSPETRQVGRGGSLLGSGSPRAHGVRLGCRLVPACPAPEHEHPGAQGTRLAARGPTGEPGSRPIPPTGAWKVRAARAAAGTCLSLSASVSPPGSKPAVCTHCEQQTARL